MAIIIKHRIAQRTQLDITENKDRDMNVEYRLHLGMFHSLNGIDGLDNVVVGIEYAYVGEAEINGTVYSHAINKSATVLAHPKDIDKDSFTKYTDITEEMAKEWVLATISDIELDMMQKNIKHNIESQSLITVSAPPWMKITQGTPNPDQTIYGKQ